VHFEMPIGWLAKNLKPLLMRHLQKVTFQTAP
jgi:hypothetical protein